MAMRWLFLSKVIPWKHLWPRGGASEACGVLKDIEKGYWETLYKLH